MQHHMYEELDQVIKVVVARLLQTYSVVLSLTSFVLLSWIYDCFTYLLKKYSQTKLKMHVTSPLDDWRRGIWMIYLLLVASATFSIAFKFLKFRSIYLPDIQHSRGSHLRSFSRDCICKLKKYKLLYHICQSSWYSYLWRLAQWSNWIMS